eukprot:11009581-Prorocentrum_lima.AAC.1
MITYLRARGEYDQSLVYFEADSGERDFGHIPFESEIFACFYAHLSNVGRDVVHQAQYHSSQVVYRRPPTPNEGRPANRPTGTGVAGAYGPARED